MTSLFEVMCRWGLVDWRTINLNWLAAKLSWDNLHQNSKIFQAASQLLKFEHCSVGCRTTGVWGRPSTFTKSKGKKTCNARIFCVCVCVCVCSLLPSMQRAGAVLYFLLWPVRLYHFFQHYLVNGTILGEKVIEYKMYFFIFSKPSSETCLILSRIQCSIFINVQHPLLKCPLFLSDFNES